MVLFGNVVVFGQSGCNRANWLQLGKSGCIRESRCIQPRWLYLVKMVLFRQSGCNWAKVNVFGQIGCIHEKWLQLGKSACNP